MLTHNLCGGTERHIQELAERLELAGTPVLFCRPDLKNPDAIHISDPHAPETLSMGVLLTSDSPALFLARLRTLGVAHVHIHNLVGYPTSMTRYLAAALVGSLTTYDVTVHDYQHWCPRITLVGITGQYCGEPDLDSCQRCVNHLGSPVGANSVREWRDGHEQLLRGARMVFTPSNDAAQRLARQLPGLAVQVRPHEVITTAPDVRTPRSASKAIRVGVIGAISAVKGREVLARLATYAAKNAERVTFVVIGTISKQAALTSLGNVRVTGRYDESALDEILVREQLDVIFFSAVWPETYSYTLTAALKVGLPIVAFDLGAIPERLRSHGVGTILSLDLAWDPKALADHLSSAAQGERFANASSHTLAYPNILADYYGLSPLI